MLTRAMIVVLVILNVGVALWWMLRGDSAPVAPATPSGVAQLQLLPSTPSAAAPAAPSAVRPAVATTALADATPEPSTPVAPRPVPAAPAVERLTAAPAPTVPETPPTATATVVLRCLSLGPFADRDIAMAAQGRAGALLQRSRLRDVPKPGSSSTYRVMMPAAASRDEAQATVKRIAAAGISDYYIIAQGEEANAIALGQYRKREGAERRLAALNAAGFNARLVGGSEVTAQWWVDAALADKASPDLARQRSGAAQQRSLDCAGLR